MRVSFLERIVAGLIVVAGWLVLVSFWFMFCFLAPAGFYAIIETSLVRAVFWKNPNLPFRLNKFFPEKSGNAQF